VAGMLNTFFVEIIDELLNQNNSKINAQLPKQRINRCSKTVTENEIECVSKSLKGKLSAGYVEIPEYLVKQEKLRKKTPFILLMSILIGIINLILGYPSNSSL
jgi:hypothetical protein